jgi:hypothetical protein
VKKLILIFLNISLTAILCFSQDTGNVNSRNSGSTNAENQSSSAQTPASPGTQDQAQSSTQSATSSAQQQTISGCLNQSGKAFTFTDSQTGTVYKLTGNTRDLSSHVGHEMQITGAPKNSKAASANATGAPSGNSAGQHLFNVSSAKHLADQCSPSAATANGPSL